MKGKLGVKPKKQVKTGPKKTVHIRGTSNKVTRTTARKARKARTH